MSAIRIDHPGLQATVQDLGRPGYGPVGVSACGAADPIALRLGNRLVGNVEGAPAVEMILRGGTFTFLEKTVIALTGAVFDSRLPFWRAVEVDAGERLEIGWARDGARCYLCVRGGLEVPKVLGSASAHIVSRLGGGPLHARQRIQIGQEIAGEARKRVRRSALETLAPRKTLRITPGPQRGQFARDLGGCEYEVSGSSNRTGIRLAGPELGDADGAMETEGVSLGAIQVTASGQPIILFVDAQTTGGYPIIANVISADLPSLGQLRPHDRIRFEWTTFEEARRLYIEQEELLRSDRILW